VTGPDAREVDGEFLELPRTALADAALQTARDLGASHADVRIERLRGQGLRLRDGRLENRSDNDTVGLAVRVVYEGTWGFAAGVDLEPEEAVRLARAAVEVARTARPLNTEPVELADEPVHSDVRWVSSYAVDPFDVPAADKVGRLAELSGRLLGGLGIDHVDAGLNQVKEQKFYADTAGTSTTQQRVRLLCQLEAVRIDPDTGEFETMRTLAPPVGRGWEWVHGPDRYDFDGEVERLPELLAAKAAAPGVEPGTYDLVIDPSNLWLTIHESIGHATELDRALGYEAAYAGTSFATLDQLGSLRYGSAVMNVTGDRTAEHGLATIGYDDDGVATGEWDIVSGGVLVGYQLDRRMVAQNAAVLGVSGSNGCAFADSPRHVPIQRMANVSLRPDPDGPTAEDLISRVERGIYIVGDKSWSIDMQRYNFQFTGQRFFRISNGQLGGQLADVAYQATTTDFWGALESVGGPATYRLGGAMNCGKGQPGQIAPVSHGAPTTLFRGVKILNTRTEGGR
jgi:TldD protein